MTRHAVSSGVVDVGEFTHDGRIELLRAMGYARVRITTAEQQRFGWKILPMPPPLAGMLACHVPIRLTSNIFHHTRRRFLGRFKLFSSSNSEGVASCPLTANAPPHLPISCRICCRT